MTTANQIVRDALQAGYGDATQGVLDDRVAGQILAALRAAGWASLEDVAAILIAAGGEVTVTDTHRQRAMGAQVFWTEPMTQDFGIKFNVRERRSGDAEVKP